MKESISNAAIFNIVMVFVSIMIAFLIGSLSYSKAFKVKNRIVDTIEKYNSGYKGNERAILDEIDRTLSSVGYRVNQGYKGCPLMDGANNGGKALNDTSSFRYCIYEFSSNRGLYYKAVAYMYFDIPLIGELLEFPVSGETRIFYGVIDEYKK